MKKIIFTFILINIVLITYASSVDKHLIDGIQAYQNREFQKAINHFNRAIDLSPRVGEAYYYLGLIYYRENELARAERNLKKALEIDPRWSSVLEKLGQIYYEQGRDEQAKKTFSDALKFNENSKEALEFFSEYYYNKKEFDKAEEFLIRLEENSSLSAELSKMLGLIYLKRQHYDKALTFLNRYSGMFPFDKDIANRLILLRMLKNDKLDLSDNIILHIKNLLKQPELSERDVQAEIARLLSQEQDDNKVVEEEKTFEIPEVSFTQNTFIDKLIFTLAGIFFFGGLGFAAFFIWKKIDFSKSTSLNYLKKKTKITKKMIEETNDEETLISYLEALKNNNQDTGLEILLLKKIGKKNPEFLYSAAIKLEENGNNTEALKILKQIKDSCGSDMYFEVLMDIIRINLKLGDSEKAVDVFRKINKIGKINMNTFNKKIQLLPKSIWNDFIFFENIIDFFLSRENTAQAISKSEKFMELTDSEENKIKMARKMVNILSENNLNREAVKIYKKLIEAQPESIENYYGIVDALLAAGDMSEARPYISTVIKGFSDEKENFVNNLIIYLKKGEKKPESFLMLTDILSDDDALYTQIREIYELFVENFPSEDNYFKYYEFLIQNDEEEGLNLIFKFVENDWTKYYNRFLDDLNNYLQKNPDDMEKVRLMANILDLSGRYAESHILFKKIFHFNPDDKQNLLNLFKTASFLQREDDILEYGNKILSLNKNIQKQAVEFLKIDNESSLQLQILHSRLMVNIGREGEAFEKLRYMEIKQPDNIKLKEFFASLLKDFYPKEALEKYKALIKINSENVYYWYEAAELLARLNVRNQAYKAYAKLLKLTEESAYIEEAIKFFINFGFFDYALKNLHRLEDKELLKKYEKKLLLEKSRFEFKILNSIQKGGDVPEEAVNHIIAGNNIAVEPTRRVREKYEKLDSQGIKLEMIEKYYYMELYDEGIELAQEILKENEHWKPRFYLGRFFLQKELNDISFREFANIKWSDSSLTLEEVMNKLYYIASLFEERNMEKEAIHFYREIFARDVNFRDVKEKIENLDTKILMSKTVDETTGLSLSIRRRYEDISELGKGGMGVVYRARDKKLGRMVALKVMLSEFLNNKGAVDRFLKEARAIAALNHPNIISIFDVNSEENVYIAMEYFDGKNLKQLLQKKKIIPLDNVIEYGQKICDGLGYAHENGIVHRDIKPENIMVDDRGNLKIMDFGLARIETEEAAKAGEVMGTPYYMSPEQIKGDPVDERTDIYSFGVTLYMILTGKLPFSEGDIKSKHLKETPVEPRVLNSDISEKMSEIIMKCLEKYSTDRYSNMKEIKKELKKVKYV
ncbi:MAG: protein kinase domain-containing protein [Candidatus Muiribacteriota bacterium]